MKNFEILICAKEAQVQGFNFKPGFAALVEEGTEKVLAATSGWNEGGATFVYRQDSSTGEWTGDWEDEETFPASKVLASIEYWQENEDMKKALAYAEGKKLHVSLEPIRFTDVYPGEKCNNGGEYGYFTHYTPIPEYPGIYRVRTSCTCDFDRCGTGYQGIRALTVREYRRLRKASDEVEAAGSLY